MSKIAQADVPKKIDMDDGYFPLAQSALLTLSKTRLSGAQRAIIDVVFTQTYGYYNQSSQHQEKVKKRFTRAQISYEFFMESTWMGKQEVSRAVNQLVKWGILGRDKNTSPYTYWFVVSTDRWAPECWRVSRIANSKQDSEQLAGQLTNCSQDSEQGVSRIANSSQVSGQECQGSKATRNKREIKEINKGEGSGSDSGSGRSENNEPPPDKQQAITYFLNLENHAKVEYLKKLPQKDQITFCVYAYNHTFPQQAEKYGTGGRVKARNVFQETVNQNGVPPEKILVEILWSQQEGEPTPWDLVNCIKDQRGLEKSQAQVVYEMEKFEKEEGIKGYEHTPRPPP